jgi:hypothetical protein
MAGSLPPPQGPPQPPSPPPAPGEQLQGATARHDRQRWWRQRRWRLPTWTWLLVASAFLIIALASLLGADDESTTALREAADTVDEAPESTDDEPTDRSDATPSTERAATTTAPAPTTSRASETTEAPTTSAGTSTTVATTTTTPSNLIEGSPSGTVGTRGDPVPPGGVADIGGGWRLQVLGWNPDATPLIMQENQFNEPPPEGSAFTLVPVALGYFGRDDPTSLFEVTISALGGSAVELSGDCGVIPNQLDISTEVFSGGVVVGNVCFVTTPGDREAMQLYATGELFGERDSFMTIGDAPAAVALEPLRGPQNAAKATPLRAAPNPVGAEVAVGSSWRVVIAGSRDGTAEVLAENQFNEPPPEGTRFVLADVILRYSGEGTGSVFDVTFSAVSESNVSLPRDCGVTPRSLDYTTDVFAGGEVGGTICFVVPVQDNALTIYANDTFSFEDDPVYLASS